METKLISTSEVMKHSTKLIDIKNLIIREKLSIVQLHKVEISKNWLFYSSSEKEEWYKKFFHLLEIKEATLLRLKEKYIETLKILTTDDSNKEKGDR